MRALRRNHLASFLLIAALAFTLVMALAPGISHTGKSLAECPAGTNWDVHTASCH